MLSFLCLKIGIDELFFCALISEVKNNINKTKQTARIFIKLNFSYRFPMLGFSPEKIPNYFCAKSLKNRRKTLF